MICRCITWIKKHPVLSLFFPVSYTHLEDELGSLSESMRTLTHNFKGIIQDMGSAPMVMQDVPRQMDPIPVYPDGSKY